MYANDTLVYSPINMLDDCIQLQKDLSVLEKYGKWSLIPQNVNFL